jgi:hypothetical protein
LFVALFLTSKKILRVVLAQVTISDAIEKQKQKEKGESQQQQK